MIEQLPDEVRLGVPGDHDDTQEIHVKSFRARRDTRDGVRTLDLEVVLDRHELRRLHQRLKELENEVDDAGTATIRFDLPQPAGVMPPDPMGPALNGSIAFITGVSAVSAAAQFEASPAPNVAQEYLDKVFSLKATLGLAFEGVNLTGADLLPTPPIPSPISLPEFPTVEGQVNRLLAAATVAVSALPRDDSFTHDGYSAALALYNAVYREFSGPPLG